MILPPTTHLYRPSLWTSCIQMSPCTIHCRGFSLAPLRHKRHSEEIATKSVQTSEKVWFQSELALICNPLCLQLCLQRLIKHKDLQKSFRCFLFLTPLGWCVVWEHIWACSSLLLFCCVYKDDGKAFCKLAKAKGNLFPCSTSSLL